MKLILKFLSIVLVLMSVPGYSQVQSQFQGTINIFVSTSTPTPYRYSLTGFFNDPNGQYASEDLEIGDVLYASEGFSCIRFTVDSIVSKAGSIISAYVTDYDSVSVVPPSGVSALLRESPNNAYPSYIPGISENLQSCILSHFMLKVDMGASGILNITQPNHGFSKWQPIYWNEDSTRFEVPLQDSLIAVYVVIDSIDANTFSVAASGTFATDLADGYYYQFDGSYSTTADTIVTPLFVVADGKLTVNPLRGYDFGDYATTWLKTELEAGTPVSIAADTTTFDITGLERARFIANRIGDYTYSSRMYNTNTPNAGMYVTNSRNGASNRIEVDTLRTRLVAYSTTGNSELAFYQDSLTLRMSSDIPQVGQSLTVSSIAADGITANMKWEYDEADILDYEHKGIGVTAEAIRERNMIIEEPYIYTYRNVFRIEEDTLISIFDLATLGSGSTTSFRKNGNFLYLNTASYLKKCDVSNPANIVVVDSIAVPSSREVLMTIENDLLYSYDNSSTAPADDQIVIRNFDLEEVRRIPYPGNNANGYLNANSLCEIYDSLLIVASYSAADTSLVTNLNTEITTKISFGLVDGAFIHKDLLYIGRGISGDTLDIYQLPSFTKIRSFAVPGDPLQSITQRSIVVNYPYIFSTNNNWGGVNKLRVLKIVGDSTLTELPYIPLLGISGRRLAYSGNNLVVANRNSNTIERIQIGKHSKQLGIDAVSVKTKDLRADNVYIKGEEVFDVKKQLRDRDVILDGKNNNSLTVKDVRKFSIASDSVTLKITSDTPSVGQALTVSSIASDGITANLKWEDPGFTGTNIRYVSPNGNNATAVAGNPNKPYQTIAGAQSGLTGSTKTVIYLYKGDYNVASFLPTDSLIYYCAPGVTLTPTASTFTNSTVSYGRIFGKPNLNGNINGSSAPLFYFQASSTKYTDFTAEFGDVKLTNGATIAAIFYGVKNINFDIDNIYAEDYEQIFQANSNVYGLDSLNVGNISINIGSVNLNMLGTEVQNRSIFANASIPRYISAHINCENVVAKGVTSSHGLIYDSPRAGVPGPELSRFNYHLGNVRYSGATAAVVLQPQDTLIDYQVNVLIDNILITPNASGVYQPILTLNNTTQRPHVRSRANINIKNGVSQANMISDSNYDTSYVTVISGNLYSTAAAPVITINGTLNGSVYENCFVRNDGTVPAVSGGAVTTKVAGLYGHSSLLDPDITFSRYEYGEYLPALSRDLNTTPLVPSLTNYSIPFQLSNITDANYTVTGDTAFTVATAGVYEITFAGSFTMASGAALVIALDITKNGTGIGRNKGVYVNTTISPITITKIVSCAAGDVIKVRIASIDLTGRSLNVDAGSNLTIKKLK